MAEEERVPYDFDNIVSGEEKKNQRDHNAHPPELAGSDLKKTRYIISQRKSCHCSRFYPTSNRSQLGSAKQVRRSDLKTVRWSPQMSVKRSYFGYRFLMVTNRSRTTRSRISSRSSRQTSRASCTSPNSFIASAKSFAEAKPIVQKSVVASDFMKFTRFSFDETLEVIKGIILV